MNNNPIWAIFATCMLVIGLIGWTLTGNWQWAAVGASLMILGAAVGSSLEKKKGNDDDNDSRS